MDPDYEQYGVTPVPSETASSGNNVPKITDILQTHITTEIEGLESDILETDKRLNETRLILDRLRAAMLISYYKQAEAAKTNSAQTPSGSQQGIHPAVKTGIGKSIPLTESSPPFKPATTQALAGTTQLKSVKTEPKLKQGKSKHRVVVGNVSKYIPVDTRQKNDQSTHKWMVYVRGPRENPDISHIVKKVWFFLHPSYKPNDLVEVTSSPFHLTRRGWGEFPVRVQLHLNDAKGRKVDIIHMLKLDRTYSGEQSLGAETHVDVELEPPGGEGASTADAPLHSAQITPKVEPSTSDLSINSAIQDTTIRHPSPQKSAHSPPASVDAVTLQLKKKRSLNVAEGVESSPGKLRLVNVKTEPTTGLLSPTGLAGSVTDIIPSIQAQAFTTGANGLTVTTNTQLSVKQPLAQIMRDAGKSEKSQLERKVTPVVSNPSRSAYSVVAVKGTSNRPHLPSAVKPEPGQQVSSIIVKPVAPKSRVSLLNSTTGRPGSPSPSVTGTNGLLARVRSPQPSIVKVSPSHAEAKPRQVSLLNRPSSSILTPSNPQTASNHALLSAPQNAADAASKPGPYVKCMLPDGRVILIKKVEGNKNGLAANVKVTKVNLPSAVSRPLCTTSSIVSQKALTLNHSASSPELRLLRKPDSKKKRVQTPPVPTVSNHTLPTLDMLPDIQTLLTHLALMYPLISTGVDSLPLLHFPLPSYADFISWPVGKRRALEWQRAKDIHRHLIKYKDIFNVQPWTTKNIVIWLRRHLYTPDCEEDTFFPLPEAISSPSPSLHLRTLAKQLVSDDSKSNIENNEEIIDITADIKAEKIEAVDDQETKLRVSLLSESESEFISDLTSQVGAKLDLTEINRVLQADLSAHILHKLYMTFMEDLIRSSYASKPAAADKQLSPSDLYRAMSSKATFQFLDNNFIEESEML